MEAEVIRRGGSYDADYDIRPRRKSAKKKEEGA